MGVLLSACGGGMANTAQGLAAAPQLPADQARCKISASSENPLVTEWPASEKANFEARLAEGAIVVGYSGCSMKVLRNCRVGGSYAWHRTTLATDTVEIHNEDELFAKLPLGAVSLQGELERSGRLAVQTTVSGQLELRGFESAGIPKDESCSGATHVVGALSIGAFRLLSGGAAKVGGSADVSMIGAAKGSSSSSETTMREAGQFGRCEASTPDAPDAQCASPIQVFLRPLPRAQTDRGPEGAIKVRFLPVRADEAWDVMVGDKKVCSTPCERWVDPSIPYTLKYDPGFFYRNQYYQVPDLQPYAGLERVQVRTEPTATGELVGGIVLTAFGGIATLTGATLTAVGCGSGGGMCTGGLITLPIGLAMVAPGVWLMVDSSGKVNVEPIPTSTTTWAGSEVSPSQR